jgi:hypothetical protein
VVAEPGLLFGDESYWRGTFQEDDDWLIGDFEPGTN